MENFELYIHGAPEGQDFICTNKIQNYLAKFYPNSLADAAHLSLVIDYKDDYSYYTYYLKGNREYSVTDFKNNRPGSYFAITVSFKGQYCTNVKMLFDLLNALFEQRICKSLFNISNKNYRYKVSSFSEVNVYGELSKLFSNNIKYLSFGSLNGCSNGPVDAVLMNLTEVDSPFFFNVLRERRVIVSSEYPTYLDRLEQLKNDINPIKQENVNLQNERKIISEANKQLEEQCVSFKKEVELQKQKIAENDSNSKKALSKLQNELEKFKVENKELKEKLNEIGESVEKVDFSTKELMRLLAGRFPEVSKEDDYNNRADDNTHRKKSSSKLWLQIFNTLLLCTFICGGVYLHYWSSDNNSLDSKLNKLVTEIKDRRKIVQPTTVQQEENKIVGDVIDYSKITRIDIGGIKKILLPGKTYTLSLQPNNVSDECGKWMCDDSAVILTGNYLSIDSSKISKDREVELQFRIGRGIIIKRLVKISKSSKE